MVFAVYFLITWAVIIIFSKMPKKLSFMQNTFVFLLVLIISMNWSWIIYEELKLVKLSTELMNYTSFLINRSIAVPLIVVITINLIKLSSSLTKSIIMTLLSTFLLTLLAIGGIYFKVTEYIHWNLAYDIFYFLMLNIISVVILSVFNIIGSKEVGSQ